MATSVFPDADLILIEPLEEMEPLLSRLCRENRNCCHIKAGVGSEEGHLTQIIAPQLASSSFLAPDDVSGVDESRKRRTPVLTLNGVIKGAPGFEPDLVKLDIQGFEIEALKGASNLFDRTELFILETSLYRFKTGTPIASETVTFMAARGYELYDIVGYLRRPYDGALGQVDLAFALEGGRLRKTRKWGRGGQT